MDFTENAGLQLLAKNRPRETRQNRVRSRDIFRLQVAAQLGGAPFDNARPWEFL